MKLHIIMHKIFESPAAITTWAEEKNLNISYTRLYNEDAFPDVNSFDFLVVMGGPQSPATTPEECLHYDAKKEIAFIKQAIEQDKILLGICLGARLIGEALGARFGHSPEREIGVFPITLTEDGKRDPIIRTFPEKFSVGHWHGDMPGLTPESKILAVSEGCPRQVVRYAPKIYGFQCHFEFTPEAVEGMIENNFYELEKYEGMSYIETAKQLRSHDYTEINQLPFTFLDKISSNHVEVQS